ncbi:hypothetical protein ACE34Q_003744 [Vibrio alginolyticus]|uniref:hypothetical protein n=1 Tax=Vibrio diabolicus TaxID=50719 RepID=UPI001D927D39|nr:hypothetical protein [Vibrio parahaemolyticus]
MAGKMVLSTSLLVAYENMAFEPHKYQKKYKRLMKLISLPYRTNKKQLLEAKAAGLNSSVYDRLMPQLQHLPDRNDSIEELASKTSLKVILTEDCEAVLPYVYYHSSFIANQITVSLGASDDRANLVKYLQMLSSCATKVTICDNYLAEGWGSTQSLFRAVLPRHKLDIHFVETPDILNVEKNSKKVTDTFAKSICTEWTVSTSSLYSGSHDRYLLIEASQGKVEVMVSSGFEHIWKANPKEVTCVVRQV